MNDVDGLGDGLYPPPTPPGRGDI